MVVGVTFFLLSCFVTKVHSWQRYREFRQLLYPTGHRILWVRNIGLRVSELMMLSFRFETLLLTYLRLLVQSRPAYITSPLAVGSCCSEPIGQILQIDNPASPRAIRFVGRLICSRWSSGHRDLDSGHEQPWHRMKALCVGELWNRAVC